MNRKDRDRGVEMRLTERTGKLELSVVLLVLVNHIYIV